MKAGWILSLIGLILFIGTFYLARKGVIDILSNLWIIIVPIIGAILFFLGLYILKESLTRNIWR
ncbi:MAG: hypothetical protein WC309_04150 [Candidatus Paceibacterota bacterium]|jgi:uncharacterized membrane protein